MQVIYNMQVKVTNPHLEIIQTTRSLFGIFNSLKRSLTACNLGDASSLLEIKNISINQYPDESRLGFFTLRINYPESYDPEIEKSVKELIKKNLPEEIQEPFIKKEHLILIDELNTTLEIHLNDTTITCMIHCTGQF